MTEYSFTVFAQPIPAPRPRVTRHGVYYNKRYVTWLALVETAARQAYLGKPPLEGPVRLFIDIYGAHASADFDNLAKGVADGIKGVMYANDRQVRYARVELHDCSPKQRRAEITVSPFRDGGE